MFNWKIIEIYAKNEVIHSIKYFVSATDEINTVETEGNHAFESQKIDKPFAELKEQDLINWLQQETTKNEINIIKLNLQEQLDRLKNSQKVQFPWETDTFTVE